MNVFVRGLFCFPILAATGCCGGGAGGVPVNTAADEAHAIASIATGARGDLAQACKAAETCAQVNTDLCDVIDEAKKLEEVAVKAGFTPTDPITVCVKK